MKKKCKNVKFEIQFHIPQHCLGNNSDRHSSIEYTQYNRCHNVWLSQMMGGGEKECVCITVNEQNFQSTKQLHILTSPSYEPDSRTDNLLGCLHIQCTPSWCPSSAPSRGFAKTLSSFVALSALAYSRGASKGCRSREKFLGTAKYTCK